MRGVGRQCQRAGSEVQGQRKEQESCLQRWQCEGRGGWLSCSLRSVFVKGVPYISTLQVLPGSWCDGRSFPLASSSCLPSASIPTCPTFIVLLDPATVGKSVCFQACNVENPTFSGNFPVSGLSAFSACAYVTFHFINTVCAI